MQLPIPIGIDNFRTLREKNAEYIDKSHLIAELIDRDTVEVVLLPRPRRFGKTLNLSMLRYFFEKRDENLWPLFEALSIARAGEKYKEHFGRYPVIFLSLKGIKSESFDICQGSIRDTLRSLYQEHAWLLDHPGLNEWDKQRLRSMLDGHADEVAYRRSLLHLCHMLYEVHKERVVILMDEYDAPIHAAFIHGYAKPLVDFFRDFFEQTFKGNPYLHKGVITGILRIARESIFSGLNNLGVYTLVHEEFSTCFGFSESEVQALLEKAGRSQYLELVRFWYNGYIFGGKIIYNPWSVLNFVASQSPEARPYWLNTSSNDLIKYLLSRRALTLKPLIEDLLKGGSFERMLDENVVLDQLESSDDALFSLLVFTGYLKAEKRPAAALDLSATFGMSIPNHEVRLLYVSTFREWLHKAVNQHGGDSERLLNALLAGDAREAEHHLQIFVSNVLSYHDATLVYPEQVYQAFVLGLLASYEWMGYRVRSNRESGAGRPDVLILPVKAGKPGVVLELKVVKASKRAPEKALKAALAQIEQKEYAAELAAVGAYPVFKLAVAFDGKKVWVRAG